MLTLSLCGGVQSHFIVKPNLVLRLGWGFDNEKIGNRFHVSSSDQNLLGELKSVLENEREELMINLNGKFHYFFLNHP